MINTQYPFQVASYLNNTQTLAFTESLCLATGVSESETDRKPVPPLETPGYSVFRVALIQGGTDKILTANIPEDDIIGIYEDSKIAKRMKAVSETAVSAQAGSAGSDVRFTSGTFRGKTPLEVLATPDGAAALEKQKSFLKSNLAKYPNNQKQIDAIDAALKANAEGASATPAPATVSTPLTYEIYNSGPKPLKSRETKHGYYFCYNITITKNLAMRYPYEISIMNCETPMKRAANGQEVPMLSKAINQVTEKIHIPEKDYFQMITKLNEFRINFRSASTPGLLKLAHRINKQNMEKIEKAAE